MANERTVEFTAGADADDYHYRANVMSTATGADGVIFDETAVKVWDARHPPHWSPPES